MILVHGFISSNLVWSDVFLPLASAGFRVIAPDLPGYGYSEKPDDAEYTIKAQARASPARWVDLFLERTAAL